MLSFIQNFNDFKLNESAKGKNNWKRKEESIGKGINSLAHDQKKKKKKLRAKKYLKKLAQIS